MLAIGQEYIDAADGHRACAAEVFANDLMRGDPAKCKAGYSAPNAAIATALALELTDDEVEELCVDLSIEFDDTIKTCVEQDRGAAA